MHKCGVADLIPPCKQFAEADASHLHDVQIECEAQRTESFRTILSHDILLCVSQFSIFASISGGKTFVTLSENRKEA